MEIISLVYPFSECMMVAASYFLGVFASLMLVQAAKNPKRGLAFADDSSLGGDIVKANQSDSTISWVYDWGTSPASYIQTSGIPYIPMQWGTSGIENFQSTVLAQGATTILAFNEPDFATQSNIPPAQAASLWLQYIEPLKSHGIRLGAPAVTSADSGAPWLSQFLGNCTSCSIDFVPFHWYGDGIGPFYDYIWSFHGQFPDYPLWVTEFASTSQDPAVVLDFLNETTIYLDGLDWIEGYSWFAFFRQQSGNYYSLLDANGNLNANGETYIDS